MTEWTFGDSKHHRIFGIWISKWTRAKTKLYLNSMGEQGWTRKRIHCFNVVHSSAHPLFDMSTSHLRPCRTAWTRFKACESHRICYMFSNGTCRDSERDLHVFIISYLGMVIGQVSVHMQLGLAMAHRVCAHAQLIRWRKWLLLLLFSSNARIAPQIVRRIEVHGSDTTRRHRYTAPRLHRRDTAAKNRIRSVWVRMVLIKRDCLRLSTTRMDYSLVQPAISFMFVWIDQFVPNAEWAVGIWAIKILVRTIHSFPRSFQFNWISTATI